MSSFSTPLSRRLGLRYPIVCAPMFLISNKEMIVACAEAGILGAMPSLNARTLEGLRADLEWIRARTSGPFAINLTIGLTDPARCKRRRGRRSRRGRCRGRGRRLRRARAPNAPPPCGQDRVRDLV